VKLTGKIQYRLQTGCFKKPKLILQVQETGHEVEYFGGYLETQHVTRYRDATVEDLQVLNYASPLPK
jgi:hypothetical protein